MPRNSSGVYTLPIAAFVPNGLIKSSDHNSNYSDIGSALTGSLPVNGSAPMTGPILLIDGNATGPGLGWNSDRTTGIYRGGAGQLIMVTSGTNLVTMGPTGVTIAGTLNITGTTTVGGLSVTGTLSVVNETVSGTLTAPSISSGTGGVSIALNSPLSFANGGTPVYIGTAASTGSANAQAVAACVPANFSLTAGGFVGWYPGFTNSTAMTLAFNGTTAKNVLKPAIAGPTACTGGEVVAGQMAWAYYDGTQYQLVNPVWLSASAQNQVISGGATVTAYSLTTGNITVNPGLGPLQYITNGGAFTITAPANDGSCVLLVTNNASAGAITFSGFTVGSNVGDTLTTTNTNKFMIYIVRINGVSTYTIKALQ